MVQSISRRSWGLVVRTINPSIRLLAWVTGLYDFVCGRSDLSFLFRGKEPKCFYDILRERSA